MVAKAVDMKLLGEEELKEKFEQLKLKVQKQIVRDASRIALRPTLAKAIHEAPELTGALKRNIVIRAGKRSRNWTRLQVTTRSRDKFPESVRKGAKRDWYYPALVEYGKNVKLKTESYLRKALDETEGVVKQKLSRLLRINILRAAKGKKGIKLRSLQRRARGAGARR